MRKISASILLTLAAAFCFSSIESDACTNVLVTKGASTDGSTMISYAADSHQLYGELYYAPAAVWNEGDMRQINEWDTGKFLGYIPQVARTYQRVGNMNEHQLIIAETTYGGRPELEGNNGIMDYGSLIYVALERAKTAREAIDIIVDLANTYGYYSSGESFSLADTEEVWIMDLIGKGKDHKGIVWVARRVPDGYICSHANQARISTFPQNDPENCIYAPDVISFAREMGYFSGEDKDFSFCDAYAPLDFSGMRGCEARAWSAFNILCDGKFTFEDENGNVVTKDAYDYIDYAMGWDKTKRFPLFVKPSRKISVKDVADVMRDHYEGTPMDMTQDIGAGGNALPYRWRPMGFEHNGKEYMNERAIATQQTGFWFVGQSRGWLPDEIGGVNWFGCDDAATSYLTPIYINTSKVPECLREGNGDMLHYSATSQFWMCNRVANACYKMYDRMAPVARAAADAFELYQQDEGIPAMDDKLARLVEKGRVRKARRLMTKYSVATAQKQFAAWTKLEELLLVKFIDGNIKAQDEEGNFLHSDYSNGIPKGLQYGGYNDRWKAAVVRDNGDILEQR